jgi:2,3-bisphosphoglycerate-independent phosphoglycerate mutase
LKFGNWNFMSNPLVLLILDGWGIAPKGKGNAIELAKKPNFDLLWKKYPHTELKAHGRNVGLPKGQVGNSEAGHINIGAGRIAKQDAVIISEAIEDGRFNKNVALRQTIEHVLENKSDLHIMGLISDDDSPHSSLSHLYALVDLAAKKGIKQIYLHFFTDGRDSPQHEALQILNRIVIRVGEKARVATIMGRFYSMDRGKNWKRTERAYDALTKGACPIYETYDEALIRSYNQNVTDEYVEPAIISSSKDEARQSRFKEKDAVIFFNLRSDRARQLTKTFVQKKFNALNRKAFKRKKVVNNLMFCAFTDFGPDLDHILTAFPSPDYSNTLPIVLKNLKQVYVSETEKFAHVTYFINGGYAAAVNGESRMKISSPVALKSYAEKPKMGALEITNHVVGFVKQNTYDFVAINFANPDMIGHTGDLRATIKAVEFVDKCVGRIAKTILQKKGTLVITADHGNAERMLDPKTNEVWSGHTINPVPFVLVSDVYKNKRLRKGVLGDIAPTIYDLLNIKKLPKNINKSLIK